MTVHALVPRCALSVLSYSEWKIAKIFLGFATVPHWGGVTGHPQTSQLQVFLLAPCKFCSYLLVYFERKFCF